MSKETRKSNKELDEIAVRKLSKLEAERMPGEVTDGYGSRSPRGASFVASSGNRGSIARTQIRESGSRKID